MAHDDVAPDLKDPTGNSGFANQEIFSSTLSHPMSQEDFAEEERLSLTWKMILRRCSRALRPSQNSRSSTSRTLNGQQRSAAEADVDTPLVILAGAGTGKTTTLLGRVQHLLKCGAQPNHILILSFTNSSADDILDRLVGTLGENVARKIHCTTIHSFSLALIRCFSRDDFSTNGISVADTRTQSAILLEAWKWSTLEYEREECRRWLQLDPLGSKEWNSIFIEFERQYPLAFLECMLNDGEGSAAENHLQKVCIDVSLELSHLCKALSEKKQAMRQGFFQYGYFFWLEDNETHSDLRWWATAKAWQPKPGMRVPKGAVLMSAEMVCPRSQIFTVTGGLELLQELNKTLCLNPLAQCKVCFQVPLTPPRGSPAALRSRENPTWRSELARRSYVKLSELHGHSESSMHLKPEKKPPKGCISMLLKRIRTAKQCKYTANDFVKTHYAGDVAFCFRFYQDRMRDRGLVDFQDMLVMASRMLQQNLCKKIVRSQVQHLLVDEFQDVSPSQLEVLQPLIGGESGRSFCAVGDDDQTVYTWNGSTTEIFDLLREKCGSLQMVKLTDNYRSTESILRVGRNVLMQNTRRIGKELRAKAVWASSIQTLPLIIECGHPEDEASAIADEIDMQIRTGHEGASLDFDNIAVLFRCFNFGAAKTYQPLVQELSRRKIPHYVIRDNPIWERHYSLDLLAYLQLASGEDSDCAFLRVLNTPPRGCGPICAARLLERQERARENSQWKSLKQVAEDILKEVSPDASKGKLSVAAQKGLRSFVDAIHELRKECAILRVDHALDMVARKTGYSEWFSKQEKKRKRNQKDLEEEEGEEGEEDAFDFLDAESDSDNSESCSCEVENHQHPVKRSKSAACKQDLPGRIAEMVSLARCFADSWTSSNASEEAALPGLFTICVQQLMVFASLEQMCTRLPADALDRMTAICGRGRLQIQDFLHHVALDPKDNLRKPGNSRKQNGAVMRTKPGVCISTIHAAKGLEWPTVFIARWNEEMLPMTPSTVEELRKDGRLTRRSPKTFEKHEFIEEERRLAHVAVTRAQKRLIITAVRSFTSKKNTASKLSSIPLPRPLGKEGSSKAAMWKRVRPKTAEEQFWDDGSGEEEIHEMQTSSKMNL